MQGPVVAGVHDDGQSGLGRRRLESAREARAAHAAGEGHDSVHPGIQPTKRMLRRLKTECRVTDSVWIVVVARVGGGAKSRLAGSVGPDGGPKAGRGEA